MPRAKSGKAVGARTLLSEYRRKRDFKKTREPSGERARDSTNGALRFVIQKHAASHLHFDLRLELDGVMKSWAVPKGPSLDPSVKRLAMEVEDHPIDYNTFEGTIPQGEYGGGTVMLWDRGTYLPDKAAPGENPESAVREGLRRGDLKISFQGERLQGSFALVRMKFSGDRSSGKPQWLLIKHRDEFASSDDVIADNMTSVDSGRTMEEIASGKARVWRSNRTATRKPKPDSSPKGSSNKTSAPVRRKRGTPASPLEPMYASIGAEIPGAGWTYEPKYDGVRVLAFTTSSDVELITRNGRDKAAQFPEIVAALRKVATRAKRSFVLDGEIIALLDGKPARFQELQSRMHVTETAAIERHSTSSPAALILFDILVDGEDVLIREPWTSRRARLVERIGKLVGDRVQITESVADRGDQMLDKARRNGWEGVIAKRIDSPYEPGNRSRAWLKLKIEFRQEFVVGGYTEPRNSREHIGALLLGYFDRDRLIYVGHTGGGFTRAGLNQMYKRLSPLEQARSPFEETPRTNERAHWVKPEIVVEVKFSEWTADRKLRQPIFLGVRDDKPAREVGKESESVQNEPRKRVRSSAGRVVASRPVTGSSVNSRKTSSAKSERRVVPARLTVPSDTKMNSVVRRIAEIEEDGGDGVLDLGKGGKLQVSNLGKLFFPKNRITKGDLMRYYAGIADVLLPVTADRPLVLKRFPNGIDGQAFYQQRAGEGVPAGVRVETIKNEQGERQERFVGGNLATILYTIQLAAVSIDPWHSRIGSLDFADYSVIDLDPGARATFARVVEVAHWCKEMLDHYKLTAAIKTSGSTGLHIYVPLAPKTPTEAATLIAQVIATKVAAAHPRVATTERSVKTRGAATVYVDYLQNIKGKTIAGAYAVRAKPGAPVSTPLRWAELDEKLNPGDYTIRTFPERLREVGDVWSSAMKKKNSLRAFLES